MSCGIQLSTVLIVLSTSLHSYSNRNESNRNERGGMIMKQLDPIVQCTVKYTTARLIEYVQGIGGERKECVECTLAGALEWRS